MEREEQSGVLVRERMTENNAVSVDGQRNHALMERIVPCQNLYAAYKRVKASKGAGGADGMTAEELFSYLIVSGGELVQSVPKGKYKPKPVRRVETPQDNGKKRLLGIPTSLAAALGACGYSACARNRSTGGSERRPRGAPASGPALPAMQRAGRALLCLSHANRC